MTPFACKCVQDELSQRNEVVDSLRGELDAAREEKNQTEQRLSDNLNELETTKRELDQAKKSCQVISCIILHLLC